MTAIQSVVIPGQGPSAGGGRETLRGDVHVHERERGDRSTGVTRVRYTVKMSDVQCQLFHCTSKIFLKNISKSGFG